MRHSGPRGIPTGGKEQLKIIKVNATKQSRLTTRQRRYSTQEEGATHAKASLDGVLYTHEEGEASQVGKSLQKKVTKIHR